MPIKGAAASGILHVVTTRSRALAAAAVSKGSSSFFTDIMLAPRALIVSSATTGRAASDDCTAKVVNPRFTVVGPCSILSDVLKGTVILRNGKER